MKEKQCDYYCDDCKITITQEENTTPLCSKCGKDMREKWRNFKINLNNCDSTKYSDIAEKMHPEAHRAHKDGII